MENPLTEYFEINFFQRRSWICPGIWLDSMDSQKPIRGQVIWNILQNALWLTRSGELPGLCWLFVSKRSNLSWYFLDHWFAWQYLEQVDWYKFCMVDQLEYDHVFESKQEDCSLVQCCFAGSDQQIWFFIFWWFRIILEYSRTVLI